MKKDYITVFTPTYNRAYKLQDLYNSLLIQDNSYFEWLIIDDGSSDNTKEIVQSFIDEGKIKIRYIYKINEGKHIAINKAAELAEGEWLFIVDSDDYLLENSIKLILEYCKSIGNDANFAGVIGLRGDSEGNIWSTGDISEINRKSYNQNKEIHSVEFIDATSVEYRYKYKIQGDRAEIIKTEILRKYPFPKFEGENFMSEKYLWFSLSKDGYKFRWFNTVIYVTEYLEDGLTFNGKLLAKKNCKSRSFIDNFLLSISSIPMKKKIKYGINYFRYGIYGGYSIKDLTSRCNNKLLCIFCLPVAIIFKIK